MRVMLAESVVPFAAIRYFELMPQAVDSVTGADHIQSIRIRPKIISAELRLRT
jgi:hypothetical protein